jgi:hypothetical protein
VFTRPADLLPAITERLFAPWTEPRAMAVTLLYGAVLLFGYVAIRVITKPRRREEPPS